MWLDAGIKGQIQLDKKAKDLLKKYGKVESIAVEEIYWRKAHWIHQFFVDEVQDGADNCAEYFVSADDLHKLLDKCTIIIADPSTFDDILPSYQPYIGDWWEDDRQLNDIKRTKERIDQALPKIENGEIEMYYRSSR